MARTGDQPPTLSSGVVFENFYTYPQICDTGAVAFMARIAGLGVTDTSNTCFFTERDGWLDVVVREGTTSVPESPTPIVFAEVGNVGNTWAMNRSGATAFRGFIDHPDSFGLWTDRGGQLSKFFRKNETITVDSTMVTVGGGGEPRINESGAIIATMLIDGGDGLFTDRAEDGSGFGIPGVGQLEPIARTGDPAPGTGNTFGTLLSNFYSMNANGRVAFRAEFAPPGPGQLGGLWSDARFGVLQLVALASAPAPGVTGEAFNFNSQFVLDSTIADNNTVVMHARLRQSGNVSLANDTGLWSTRTPGTGLPGNLRLVVREGDPVPASAGPDYAGLDFGEVSRFFVNDAGLITFVTLHNDFTNALWQERPDGTLAPIVKEFTLLDLHGDGTDQRLVTELDVVTSTAATGDGRRNALNDSNDVALRISFADGTEGIFTTAPPVACSAPLITTQPASQAVTVGDFVALTVEASGAGPLRHQWRKDGADIPGAISPDLTFQIISGLDAGEYDCLIENPCGQTTSAAAVISIGVSCPCDTDGAAGVDVFDLLAYLDLWFAGDAAADIDGTPGVDVFDLLEFLDCWFPASAGGPCP